MKMEMTMKINRERHPVQTNLPGKIIIDNPNKSINQMFIPENIINDDPNNYLLIIVIQIMIHSNQNETKR